MCSLSSIVDFVKVRALHSTGRDRTRAQSRDGAKPDDCLCAYLGT